jgi:hypothetical protein
LDTRTSYAGGGCGRTAIAARGQNGGRHRPVGTTTGTCKWQKLVLNRAGKKLDAIRFAVPPGEPREMTRAFISPPRGVTAWFVLPVDGQMDMPEHFGFASDQADQWKGVEAPPRSTIIMQSWPARLDGGKEYIICSSSCATSRWRWKSRSTPFIIRGTLASKTRSASSDGRATDTAQTGPGLLDP